MMNDKSLKNAVDAKGENASPVLDDKTINIY